MKCALFPRLAWMGIAKNRRVYLPYLLSCTGMVFMYYLLEFLSASSLWEHMLGGGSVKGILLMGKFVMAFFAALFLAYTHSFLLRKRNRESGLYHVLGMDKKGIIAVVAWETLITALLSLTLGLGLGVAFSKLAELGLVNMLRGEVDYCFRISPASLLISGAVFAGIYLLLLLSSIWQLWRQNTMELLKSESAGEKAPAGNVLLSLLGLWLLAGAYYMAVTIRSPLAALMLFFVAVIMVIAATYVLFITGSVTLCRRLQRNRGYYYRKRHFVAVSSMAYRMKRNGAGLASICILSTMVLVVLSTTASLYLGAEDALRSRYPRECSITVWAKELEELAERRETYRESCEECLLERGVTPERVQEYALAELSGLLRAGELQIDPAGVDNINYGDLRTLLFMSARDYEGLSGQRVSIQPGEALIACCRCTYEKGELALGSLHLAVAGTVDYPGELSDSASPSILFVVREMGEILPLQREFLYPGGERTMLSISWSYGYDLPEQVQELSRDILYAQGTRVYERFPDIRYSTDSLSASREDFYGMFGALFFLGLLLSVVFLFAAALIIYYKQVSEGYEDQSRFEIMQKVGMTREDIRESIRAQVRIVFFAPLLAAFVHLAFAMPLLWKLLQLFSLHNLPLVLLVTGGSCLLFAAVYALIYGTTARTYYTIVSG